MSFPAKLAHLIESSGLPVRKGVQINMEVEAMVNSSGFQVNFVIQPSVQQGQIVRLHNENNTG
jgi:hypothetical protein